MTRFGKRLFYLFRHKHEVYASLFEDHSVRRLRNRHENRFLFQGFIPMGLMCWSVAIFVALWERYKIEQQWDIKPGSFPTIDYPEFYTPYARDETKHLFFPGGLNEEDLMVAMELNREQLKNLQDVQREKLATLDKFRQSRETV